jgi:tRNA-dihydrouridine synthase B
MQAGKIIADVTCIMAFIIYNNIMLKIGSVSLKSNLILAPLMGTSDTIFRMLRRKLGCELAFFEPIDANEIVNNRKKYISILSTHKNDIPVGAQIIGNSSDIILEAAHIILDIAQPCIIDLNFACPLKNFLLKRSGAYFLKEPKKAAAIIKTLSDSLPVPITIKVRSGSTRTSNSEGLRLAQMAEDNGAKAIFFHGRNTDQGFSGNVDYDSIKKAKNTLHIPVIGSGNILSAKLAKKMFDETGCDGLLVARGAIMNPFIFRHIKENTKLPFFYSLISSKNFWEVYTKFHLHKLTDFLLLKK